MQGGGWGRLMLMSQKILCPTFRQLRGYIGTFCSFFISMTFSKYTKNCTLPRNVQEVCSEVQEGTFSSSGLSNGDGSSAFWELYLYFRYVAAILFTNFVQVGMGGSQDHVFSNPLPHSLLSPPSAQEHERQCGPANNM